MVSTVCFFIFPLFSFFSSLFFLKCEHLNMVISCLYDVAVKYGSVRSLVDLLNGNSHNVWGASFFSLFFSPHYWCVGWQKLCVCECTVCVQGEDSYKMFVIDTLLAY